MFEKNTKMRIMVFGTFDGLHPGHRYFFKQARKLATPKDGQAKIPFLIVSIARDKNVFRIKGSFPRIPEKERVILVRNSKLADKVVLSGAKNHLPHIIKERPEIIALGYDQKNYIKNLKADLKKKGLRVKIVRLRPYKEKIYKNHLLKKQK